MTTLKSDFVDALRACGEPSRLDQIHEQHQKGGGKHTYAAFKMAAWDLTNEKQIEIVPNTKPRQYTLPHNAFARQRLSTEVTQGDRHERSR